MISSTNSTQSGMPLPTVNVAQINKGEKLTISIVEANGKVQYDYMNGITQERMALKDDPLYSVRKDKSWDSLWSAQGYKNFQSYIKQQNLKEEDLTQEEIGFYALKANTDFIPSAVENTKEYQVYKEYLNAYDDTLSSLLDISPGQFSNANQETGAYLFLSSYTAATSMKNGPATLMTGAGEARMILDLNNSNTIDNKHENLLTRQLLAIDTNHDGLLDGADAYFDKLKFVMKDDNGNDKIVKASSIMSFIDLEQFVDKDKVEKNKQELLNQKEVRQQTFEYGKANYTYNESSRMYIDYDETTLSKKVASSGSALRGMSIDPFKAYVDAKYTYKHLEPKAADDYFEQFADKNGWVEFGKNFGSVGAYSQYLNFGYMRKDADGKEYLQKFNSGYNMASDNIGDQLGSLQSKRFNSLYSEYNKLKEINDTKNAELAKKLEGNSFGVDTESLGGFKSAEMRALEKEFETTTGLSFSLENLEKVKSLVDQGKTSQAFKDMDEVVAMRKNDDGTYTLKFNTGRTLDVDELYYDTGDFLDVNGDKSKRASMVMNDELKKLDKNVDDMLDENEIDFGGYAIEKDGKLQTLKDIGVKAILLYQNPGKVNMELLFNDNNKDNTKQTLYKVTDISNPYKMSIEQLKEYINHPYNTPLEDSSSKIRIYEGRG